jgi:hypothetical protein
MSELNLKAIIKFWPKLTAQQRRQHLANFEQRIDSLSDQERDDLATFLDKLASAVRG